MKTAYLLKAILLCSLPIASQGYGQEPIIPIGTISKVTIGLTISSTGPGTAAKDPETGKPLKKGTEGAGLVSSNEWTITKNDEIQQEGSEYVTKIIVKKYSNKEFLLDLVDYGVIPDITGWSVVKAQESITPEDPNSGATPQPGFEQIFLVNKNSDLDPINVSEHLSYGYSTTAYEGNSSTVLNFKDGEPVFPFKKSFASKFKGQGGATIEFARQEVVEGDPETLEDDETFNYSDNFYLNGAYTGGQKLSFLGAAKTPVLVPAAGKLVLFGQFNSNDESEDIQEFGFVEGSISFSAGKVTDDLSAFEFQVNR